MKVKITSDSTCDLSPELVSQYDIGILPLLITFGEEIYRDGVDITPDDIYRFVDETGSLPKTCALNTLEYEEFFPCLSPSVKRHIGTGSIPHRQISIDLLKKPDLCPKPVL